MQQNEWETPHRQIPINRLIINDQKVICGAQLVPTLLLQVEHGVMPTTTDLLTSTTKSQNLKGAFPMFRTIHVKTVLCKNWLYWVLYTIFVLLIIVLFWLRCDSFDFRYFVQFCFRRNGFSSSMRAHSWLEW